MSQVTLPTMDDILALADQSGVEMELRSLGPAFRVTARAAGSSTNELLGEGSGCIKLWTEGLVLHLDTVRMTRASVSLKDRPVFGVGMLIGAVAVRHGYERGCAKAELLAINDSEFYHRKLVRYYKRLGFREIYEVTGGLKDLPHMLVWGGVGTRMDANITDLLVKWSKYFVKC